MTAILHPYRSPTTECPECGGEGQAYYEVMMYGGPPGAYSPYEEKLLECQKCQGTGELEIDEQEVVDAEND